jgi:hypothetical protein
MKRKSPAICKKSVIHCALVCLDRFMEGEKTNITGTVAQHKSLWPVEKSCETRCVFPDLFAGKDDYQLFFQDL